MSTSRAYAYRTALVDSIKADQHTRGDLISHLEDWRSPQVEHKIQVLGRSILGYRGTLEIRWELIRFTVDRAVGSYPGPILVDTKRHTRSFEELQGRYNIQKNDAYGLGIRIQIPKGFEGDDERIDLMASALIRGLRGHEDLGGPPLRKHEFYNMLHVEFTKDILDRSLVLPRAGQSLWYLSTAFFFPDPETIIDGKHRTRYLYRNTDGFRNAIEHAAEIQDQTIRKYGQLFSHITWSY